MTTTTAPTTTDLRHLELAAIAPDPGQPRKRFDRAQLDELATSIATVGLLEPIIVRPTGETYTIIAGERRWRAAGIAGLATIPAIVRHDLEPAAAFELSMIENIVRADMNPIEEAAGYRQLVDSGMTVDTIAARLGKTAQDVRFRMKLLELDRPIADLVAAGQLGVWDAWHIARLTIEGQHRVIRAMNAGELNAHGALHRLALAIFAQEAEVPMFGEVEVEATPAALAKTSRDLVAELARARTALERATALVAGAAMTAETRELAAATKRAAVRLAASVDAAQGRAQARQLAAIA